ncbi:hypothetical protein MIV045R [Invertebrate iridescent virus 3]|uniref:Uncharacterized protein 045R n=1 Tax=Invertebrate iridescent virus 3 TaxID=345201 RepID=045R_IIV3|nr:hypothetical protein MIV045R [Invertebrate iridescent virus 3]Q197B5.1 RecName: Full=Uncharacterized protein 045R [Invertebrate iridescent virus 3]ABF82075.1 hypothetical protein MIV045R [Invertebrate iridescent virus 3]
MYKCSQGAMNTEKVMEKFVIQSRFREMYPDKAKAIAGMTVPARYADSVEDMVAFANEKIRVQKAKVEAEKNARQAMGAPAKFDKYGKYKY